MRRDKKAGLRKAGFFVSLSSSGTSVYAGFRASQWEKSFGASPSGNGLPFPSSCVRIKKGNRGWRRVGAALELKENAQWPRSSRSVRRGIRRWRSSPRRSFSPFPCSSSGMSIFISGAKKNRGRAKRPLCSYTLTCARYTRPPRPPRDRGAAPVPRPCERAPARFFAQRISPPAAERAGA